MGNYFKPQSPLQIGEDNIYPLTTIDQIMMEDGARLNTAAVIANLEQGENTEDFIFNDLGLFANVKDYGAVGDGSKDDSAAFQLALNDNKCIYAPPGDYLIGTTLSIWQNHSRFYCEGRLIVDNCAAVSISANSNDVYIRKIDTVTNYTGEGVRVGSSSTSPYYNTIEIGTTGRLDKGIVLAPDGQGIAYTTVRFKEIIANYGIVFEPTATSGSFINENTFIGGAISGGIPIYTVKNGATDPFNGNKFQNIGLEQCSGGMILNWFQNNHFIGCRFAKQENSWNTFVTLDENSYGNIFNCTGFIYVDQIVQAEQAGGGNIFDSKLLYNTGSGDIELGRRGIMLNKGMVIPKDDKYDYYTTLSGSSNYDYGSYPYAIEGHTYNINADADEIIFTVPGAYWYNHALFFDLNITSSLNTVRVVIRHPEGWLATITSPGLYRVECNAAKGWTARRIDGANDKLLDFIYPVGSIYMSTNSTSPASLFGGTWEQLKDRFLLGAGSSYSAGATGGEASVILTEAQLPAHHHSITTYANGGSSDINRVSSETGTSGTGMETGTANTANTGSGEAHNNMPPYLVVYMWKRVS